MRTLVRLFVVTGITVVCLSGQTPGGYVDYYIAKVKPEKRTDFEGLAKKIADANRKNKGDHYLAYAVEYGDQGTVMFGAVRENLAAIDQANASFMSALKEAFGPAMGKLLQDMNNCTVSTRGELRRRRPDLSRNMPDDPAALAKYMGESKWLRFVTLRVRPGHIPDFEENMKALNAALANSPDKRPVLASQVIAGLPGGTYYWASFYKSMADMDNIASTDIRKIMGEDGYARFQKASAENLISTEYSIARIVPEMSNPTPEIASAAPEFWNPKPAAAPKPKPKAPATGN